MNDMGSRRAAIGAAVTAGRRVGQSDTLAALALGRGVAPVRALAAFQFIAAWGLVHDELGREPRNVDEIAESLGMSRRTAFKWQECFRAVFPEYSTPAVLWQQIAPNLSPATDPVVLGFELGGVAV